MAGPRPSPEQQNLQRTRRNHSRCAGRGGVRRTRPRGRPLLLDVLSWLLHPITAGPGGAAAGLSGLRLAWCCLEGRAG